MTYYLSCTLISDVITLNLTCFSNTNISFELKHIGPVSREPDFLVDMISAGMNIARMNFSHGTHEYHGQTIANVRKAVEKFNSERGYDPCIAIALDTKGPEIRTGILEGDDGRKEVTLEMGATIKITTDDQYKEKCSQTILWVDYKNITKVLSPGKRIFIDDGLISVIVSEIGKMIIDLLKKFKGAPLK